MKAKSLFTAGIIAASFLCNQNIYAQDPPSTGGDTYGLGPSWAGDTIIGRTPIGGIGGNIHHTPSAAPTVCAIYYQKHIVVVSDCPTSFSYSVLNEEQYTIAHGQNTAFQEAPALISLPVLPSGRYSLLLYINKECLEGEFEKE